MVPGFFRQVISNSSESINARHLKRRSARALRPEPNSNAATQSVLNDCNLMMIMTQHQENGEDITEKREIVLASARNSAPDKPFVCFFNGILCKFGAILEDIKMPEINKPVEKWGNK